jgi:hypothetical protein
MISTIDGIIENNLAFASTWLKITIEDEQQC